ncbi:MAG: MFS transporter, partial [Stenotrophomonas sp.]
MTPASPSTRRLALLLAGLAMFGPFSIDTIFPAFLLLGDRMQVDQVAVQQTVSVYLLFYGLMSLAHGPLSDAFGRKRVIIGGLVLFIGASIGCALSRDMTTLLVFRALQGVTAGVGVIVGRAVIRDLYHGADAQRLMSQVSMIFGVAPAIAPIIGGWILLGGGDWPLIFWFLVLFGVMLLLATGKWLPETHPVQARTPLSMRELLRSY